MVFVVDGEEIAGGEGVEVIGDIATGEVVDGEGVVVLGDVEVLEGGADSPVGVGVLGGGVVDFDGAVDGEGVIDLDVGVDDTASVDHGG